MNVEVQENDSVMLKVTLTKNEASNILKGIGDSSSDKRIKLLGASTDFLLEQVFSELNNISEEF